MIAKRIVLDASRKNMGSDELLYALTVLRDTTTDKFVYTVLNNILINKRKYFNRGV